MKNAGKTVASVAFISICLRVLALLGKTIYTAYFGATVEMSLFVFALNIPNIIFNSLGTAMNLVVIPVYMSLLASEKKDKAKKFLDNIISISGVLILILVLAGITFAPFIGQAVTSHAADFQYSTEDFKFLVYAIRILMPVMFFYGLNYIFQGVLQSNGKFTLPAMVTLPSSLIIIGYTVFLGERFGVKGLTVANLIALIMQPLILLPAVKKLGYKYKPSFEWKSPYILDVGKRTLPVLISSSAYQINTFFSSYISTRFEGINIVMSYAQEIVILSTLTIVYAITGVYFPRLTALWAQERKEEYKETLRNIILVVLFLLIPAGAGFFILKYDIINLLLNYGNIEESKIYVTGNMLGIYGISVLFVALKEVLDRAFYSQQNTKTPAVFGFVIMASNVIITFGLLNYAGKYSMPLAYALSSFIGTIGLFLTVNKRMKIINKEFLWTSLKCIVSAFCMIIVLKGEMRLIKDIDFGSILTSRILKILIPVGTGILVYFVSALFLKIPQALVFLKIKRLK